MRGFAHLCFLPFHASKSWEETFDYTDSVTQHTETKKYHEHHSAPKYFIGHFINLSDHKNYGIKATLSPTPPPPSHNIHSCLLEHPIYYDLTLQDYARKRQWTLKWVGWWGGDAGWMSSDPNSSVNDNRIKIDQEHESTSEREGKNFEQYVWFRTNRLKANEEAQKHIKKFMPKLEIDKEDLDSAHICLGDMEMVVEVEQEGEDNYKKLGDHDREDELHEEDDDLDEKEDICVASGIDLREQIEESVGEIEDEEQSDNDEMVLFSEKELEKICDRFANDALGT
ncbi:4787_t:CDS:1, partial [Acaulospora morrowiae]